MYEVPNPQCCEINFIIIRNSSDILERISHEVGAVYMYSAKPYLILLLLAVLYM